MTRHDDFDPLRGLISSHTHQEEFLDFLAEQLHRRPHHPGGAVTSPAPIATIDTRNRDAWDRIVADRDLHRRLVDWARDQHLTPENIYRLEIYLVDCPSARVFEYDLDDNGRRYAISNDIARREPYTVILTSLPPVPQEQP